MRPASTSSRTATHDGWWRYMNASMSRTPAASHAWIMRSASAAVSAILEFGRGVASFTVSTRAEDDQRVHVHGTSGRISVEIPFNIPPDRSTRIHVASGGDPPVAPNIETLTFPPADPYTAEAAAFAAAVLEDRPVPVPPADAVANLRVIEAIFAAADSP